MGCAFCLTAKMGFVRQLTAGEIVGQFIAARNHLAEGERFHNIVFMGMGEPLDNFDATVKAVKILTHPQANGVSARRLTVSTVGVVSRLRDFVFAVPGVGLAVSLHAADDETRGKLVPLNRKWNLRALIDECRELPVSERRRITFEYVMLLGVNDSKLEAKEPLKAPGGAQVQGEPDSLESVSRNPRLSGQTMAGSRNSDAYSWPPAWWRPRASAREAIF